MRLTRIAILIGASVVLLAPSGCNPAAHQLPGMGTPQPADVPADFPVYPAAVATLQGYGRPPSPGATSKDRREFEDITWATDDSGAKTFAFYKAGLAKGDWVLQSAVDNNHGGLIIFNRKSNPSYGGTIFLADGKIHVIMGQDCPCGTPS
ncbi:MAG TPA: hypothetical protein VEL12_00960 [Candidatus Nitrosopolaris sp.]|nr:hypothetical protein [Candidatus Nitrosopolaris sp.]